MSGLGRSEFDAYLKTAYADGVPETLSKRKKVLLSTMARKDDLVGDGLKIPLQYGNVGGRSASVTNLFDNGSQMSAAKRAAFTITPASDYGAVLIDAQTMMAARDNKGAFMRAKQGEIDSMLDELSRSAEIALWGSGSGSIGRRLSASGDVITLYNARDVKNFTEGQTVVFSTADGGGSLKAGSTTVTHVDYDAGTIEVEDITDITTPANDDYIFVQGDYDAKMKGIAAWIPLTAPGATSFYGVDRTVNVQALSGNRITTASSTIEEAIMTLSESIGDFGGSPDAVFMSPKNFNTLNKSLGSKIEFDGGGGTATMGFEYIRIATSAGVVKVRPAPYCPDDRGYMLQLDTWTLHTLGEMPHIVQDDGLMALRQRAGDGLEVRGRYYAQPACDAPGWNGVFAI
jgi:hypothetical protein